MDTEFVKDAVNRAQAAQKEINDMGVGPVDDSPAEPAPTQQTERERAYWNAPISELTIKVDKRDPRLLRVYVDGELWERVTVREVRMPEKYRIPSDPEFEYEWVSAPRMRNKSRIGPNSAVSPWNQETFGRALAAYLTDDYYGDMTSLADRLNPALRQEEENK